MTKRNILLRKCMTIMLSLALVFTMMPMVPGAVEKVHAEGELLTAPIITIDEDGVATWDAVEGAADYSWTLGNGNNDYNSPGNGSIASNQGRSFNIKQWLADNSKEKGVYTFSIYACNSSGDQISDIGKGTYAYEVEIIDKIIIDYTMKNAHPAASACDLTKELRDALEYENISNGIEDVAFISNVYVWEHDNPEHSGAGNQIESDDTYPINPECYYFIKLQIRAKSGFDFKHDGAAFDTSSLTTMINEVERDDVAHDHYNAYWKLISLYTPIEIDTSDKVHSIEITNSDVNVEKGSSIQFNSKIVSYGDGYDAVTWSMEGAEKAGTTITENGLLSVAEDETAETITVKVTANKDAEKYDTVTLTVMDKLAIDSVTVAPASVSLYAGDTKSFTATVTGTDTHEVTWELTGNNSAGTTITPNNDKCTLNVDAKETAETLSLKVTSVKDPTKSATSTITVKQLTMIDRVEINYTTENAVAGISAYELTKELRNAVEGKNISNGTEDVGYCMNVYLWSYTQSDYSGTGNQIESNDTELLDPSLYYLANFEINAFAGFDFKHDGTTFDTTSLTAVINGDEDAEVIINDYYNEYWKGIEINVPIMINKVAIEENDVILSNDTFAYTGTTQGPNITVKDGEKTLAADTDYTISGNTIGTAAGTYTFTIEGKGNYEGSIEKTFTINPCTHDWDEGTVTKNPTCNETGTKVLNCEVPGCGATKYEMIPVDKDAHPAGSIKDLPAKAATCKESGLTAGKQCTACGTVTVAQTEVPKLTTHTYGADNKCTVCGEEKPGTGGETTTDPGTTPGTGGSTSDSSGGGTTTDPGTAPGTGTTPDTGDSGGTVTPTPTPTPDAHQHSYVKTITKATAKKDGSIVEKCACGDVKSSVVIKKASKIKLSKSSYVYTGKVIKAKNLPKVIVKDSAGKTIAAANYTVVKPKNEKKMKALGKYAYTIKFKGDKYQGSVKVYLEITPAKVTAKAPKAAKKAVTVKWKKGKKAQVTGYQVTVATNKKFTKNVKTKKIKGYSKTSYKMTKLKAKTKYYVKVRAYKVTKTGTVYGPWSAVKNAKTK